jgi:hypothetical protein
MLRPQVNHLEGIHEAARTTGVRDLRVAGKIRFTFDERFQKLPCQRQGDRPLLQVSARVRKAEMHETELRHR